MIVATIFTSTTGTMAIGQSLLFLAIAIVGFILNRKSKQIHVLVNSRLDQALQQIKELQQEIEILRLEKELAVSKS